MEFKASNIKSVPASPFYKIEGEKIVFPQGTSKEFAEQVLNRLTGKDSVSISKAWSPSEEEKEKIKALLKGGVEVDSLGFYETIASTNDIDSQRDMLTPKVLREMAKQYEEGRTVLFMHNGLYPIGRTVSAKVKKAGEKRYELHVKFYVNPKAQIPSGTAKDALDTGVINRASIAMRIVPSEYIEGSKSKDSKGYFVYDDPKLQVNELSLVHMGANYQAILKGEGNEGLIFNKIDKPVNRMEIDKIILKSQGSNAQEVEVSKALAEKLDQEIVSLQKELKTYREKEEQKLKALREEFVQKSLQIVKDAPEGLEAQLREEAGLLTSSILERKISDLNASLAKIASSQTQPERKAKNKSEEGKPLTLAEIERLAFSSQE